MKILGISGLHHDSAACLLEDGTIRAAAEEERFSRRKHDAAFPIAAIAYCLEETAMESAKEIDIVIFHEKPTLVFDRIVQEVLQGPLWKAPRRLKALAPAWASDKPGSRLAVEQAVRCLLPGFRGKVLYSAHHVSHAASAFFASPFSDAAILTVDGVGEWVTASISLGKGNDLSVLRELKFPNSLGLFYAAFTEYTGFSVNGGEDKMMWLAASGQPSYYGQLCGQVISVLDDGSVEVNKDYLDVESPGRIATRRLVDLLGCDPRDPGEPIRDFDRDLASSVQKVAEDAMLAMAKFARSITGAENLCLAGGVALNCVANGRLRRRKVFRRLWAQPASGNAGASLGAAFAAWHLYLNEVRTTPVGDLMNGASLGPEYTSVEIREFLNRFDLPHRMLSRSEVPQTVAQLVADGKIVGLLHGRMEFGPRALGNRSILGDPRRREIRAHINTKIKGRESFWPCPSAILGEKAPEWFELDSDSNYMSFATLAKRSEISGAVHVDGSARPQTVQEHVHPVLHAILCSFERITAVPVLLNTSFSGPGEPIVCSPIDAYRCMMLTEIDCIVMEDVLVWRHEQPGCVEHSQTSAA